MFNLQGSEIIVILLLALVILGPEKLPDAIRKFAQTYGELKKMGTGFQSELKSVLDEPIREMKETARMVQDAADPQKISDQAAEDIALRAAAESADRAGIADVPISEAALESTDPAYEATAWVDEVRPGPPGEPIDNEPNAESDVSTDEPDDAPPVIINQIAAANARGPINPVVPAVAADDVDNVTSAPEQSVTAAGSIADADVNAG